jgi:hypothetical protein
MWALPREAAKVAAEAQILPIAATAGLDRAVERASVTVMQRASYKQFYELAARGTAVVYVQLGARRAPSVNRG